MTVIYTRKCAEQAASNMGLPDSYFDDYITTFGELFDKLPKQLIHRDPNPSNILFDGGEVTGFIDFDLSHRNIRLLDPCYCATGILSEWRDVEKISPTEIWNVGALNLHLAVYKLSLLQSVFQQSQSAY